MVQTLAKRITFEDYLTYDDGTDNRYELFDGALLLITPPTGEHRAIAGFLHCHIKSHAPIRSEMFILRYYNRIVLNTQWESP